MNIVVDMQTELTGKTSSTAQRFAAALLAVESTSIREWARSQPKPWLSFVKSNPQLCDKRLATFIVATALGM